VPCRPSGNNARIPTFGLADRADGGLHGRGHAVGIGERPADRVLQRLQLLGALALGDGPADAAVAFEGAGCVEDRLAAHADPDLPAGRSPAQLQIAEGLARIEQGDVRGPVGFAHVVVLEIPTLLPLTIHSGPLPEEEEVSGTGRPAPSTCPRTAR